MRRPTEGSAVLQRATLRITGGLSIQVGCSPSEDGAPQLITIGASPTCDWQIHAPGVAQQAMSLAVIEGVLYAASCSDAEVTINGHPLSEAWYKVSGRALFRLGAAELELRCSAGERAGGFDAEVNQPPQPVPWRGDPAVHVSGGDPRLPSLLEPVEQPNRGARLAHFLGLILFATVSYFAWLVILDRV